MSDSKTELRAFLDSMIDKNPEQAQVHFHNYLQDKTKSILHPELKIDDAQADDETTEK